MSVDDFETLANHILAFAKKAIAEDGCLFPIAAAVSVGGDVIPLTQVQPSDINDTVGDAVEAILRALRGLARERRVRAAGWCIDMRVVPRGATAKTDALALVMPTFARTHLSGAWMPVVFRTLLSSNVPKTRSSSPRATASAR